SAKRVPLPHTQQIRRAGVRGYRTGPGRDRARTSRRVPDGNAGFRASTGRRHRMSAEPIVDVQGLTVDFLGGVKPLRAVAGVDLILRPGETLALLGESGSGKSVTLRALMRLLPERRAVVGGRLKVDGQDVRALSDRALSAYRGRTIAMIF